MQFVSVHNLLNVLHDMAMVRLVLWFWSGLGLDLTAPARQRASYGDCLEAKREYYQNCCGLDCVTMFTVSSTLI